ncbi:MAG: hypothetical protein APF84_13615 [Gracilibacter sp. BRH_c7a]|nr:MAG: hypothetical protein APF84_13615 [Gracilibacter sp. BRH_c7a]
MKKTLHFSRPIRIFLVLMTLISLLLLAACGNTNPADSLQSGRADQSPSNIIPDELTPNPIDANQEKIGSEYTVLEGQDLAPDNSHGSVKNYYSDYQGKRWTVTFDAMNSTAYQSLEIDPHDKLKIKSKLLQGTVWIKITQGALNNSALQKIQLVNDETITLDLSLWQTGEIAVWLVVENAASGIIRVEQDFYAQSDLASLTTTPLTKESWQNPEKIEVPILLDSTLKITENERLRSGNQNYVQNDYKIHIPAEVIEPLVYRYFNVSEKTLRSSDVYFAEQKEYVFSRVPTDYKYIFFEIDKISRQGEISTIDLHYSDYPTLGILKKVTLVVDESGQDNKFLSCEATEPTPADREPESARSPEIFPAGFKTDWSFTGKPQGEIFHGGRDIYGVSFSLTYDEASGQYTYAGPGMGDCDKIISYTLTGTDFTVVLNGKYKLLYPDIPAWVGFYEYDQNGKLKPKDGYRMRSNDIVTGADGNYYLKIPFDWPYQKGEIPYINYSFGKID